MSTSDPASHPAPAVPATFFIRAGARIIDTVLGVVLGLVLIFPTAIVIAILAQTGLVAPTWQAKIAGIPPASLAVSVIGTLAYHTLSESIGGATVGKWICGLRVRSAVFSPDRMFVLKIMPCSFGGALIRSLAFFVDALFCAAVAYVTMSKSAWQQRLGDEWGKTIVVQAKSLEERGDSPIIGVLVGLATWCVFIVLSTFVKLL